MMSFVNGDFHKLFLHSLPSLMFCLSSQSAHSPVLCASARGHRMTYDAEGLPQAGQSARLYLQGPLNEEFAI